LVFEILIIDFISSTIFIASVLSINIFYFFEYILSKNKMKKYFFSQKHPKKRGVRKISQPSNIILKVFF